MDAFKLFDVTAAVALVTGGSRGIGRMVAEGLLRAGARVYICARKQPELDETVAALSAIGPCHGIAADLGTPEGCRAIADSVATREDRLNILVNNAGATWGAPIDAFPRDAFDKVMTVNVTGVFDLTRHLLPLLRTAARAGEPARVINISSLAGIEPPETESFSYSSSKAAVLMLTRHLARRLASEGITVNAIAPGVFPSRMTAPFFREDGSQDKWDIPLGRVGAIEDIAGTVIFLGSRAGAYLTGAVLPLSGGMGTAN
ncbi:MAG: SDR family NAD(P)-dependent oxidoreductase [Novosphingobium sp.]